MFFTTVGRRGVAKLDCCEHEHASRDDAQRCLLEHANEMRRQNKVSQREVVEINSLDELYEESEFY